MDAHQGFVACRFYQAKNHSLQIRSDSERRNYTTIKNNHSNAEKPVRQSPNLRLIQKFRMHFLEKTLRNLIAENCAPKSPGE